MHSRNLPSLTPHRIPVGSTGGFWGPLPVNETSELPECIPRAFANRKLGTSAGAPQGLKLREHVDDHLRLSGNACYFLH